MAAQLVEVAVEGLVLAGQGAQGDLCRLGGLCGVAGTEPGAPSSPLRSRERLGGAAQPVRSGDDKIADLIGDAGAMRPRRAQRDPDRARIDSTIPSLPLGAVAASPLSAARAAASASTVSDLPRRRRI